jgi:hypothetical protein
MGVFCQDVAGKARTGGPCSGGPRTGRVRPAPGTDGTEAIITPLPDPEIVGTLSRQLGWSHFVLLLPLEDPLKQKFYAEMGRVERWRVHTLGAKIQGMLFERTALAKKPAKVDEVDRFIRLPGGPVPQSQPGASAAGRPRHGVLVEAEQQVFEEFVVGDADDVL